MTSNTIQSHDPAELGELERAVLELIWEHGVQSAEQVREHLVTQGPPLKESTIRTVLRRLEEKGYVAHAIEGRTFLYRPAASRQLHQAAVPGQQLRSLHHRLRAA